MTLGVIWQPAFDRFILAVIFANTYALAMDHHSEADCLSTFQPEQPCQVPRRAPEIARLPGCRQRSWLSCGAVWASGLVAEPFSV